MSGPKRSSYTYRDRIYEELREKRRQERQRQLSEIQSNIKHVNDLLKQCLRTYGDQTNQLVLIVKSRIEQVEHDCRGDLRLAWSGVRGVEDYLQTQMSILKKRKMEHDLELEKKRIEEEKQREEERKRTLANMHIKYFDELKEIYPQLVNPGIVQRIELFREALSINPENLETLERMNEFKTQFAKIVDDYEFEQDKLRYLKKTLEDIIETDGSDGNNGSITGSYEGVPVTIDLDSQSNSIVFDFPDDGSCKPNIKRLIKSLEDVGISLGPIEIIKTGEIVHNSTLATNDIHRARA